jgi:hypothetical protein
MLAAARVRPIAIPALDEGILSPIYARIVGARLEMKNPVDKIERNVNGPPVNATIEMESPAMIALALTVFITPIRAINLLQPILPAATIRSKMPKQVLASRAPKPLSDSSSKGR